MTRPQEPAAHGCVVFVPADPPRAGRLLLTGGVLPRLGTPGTARLVLPPGDQVHTVPGEGGRRLRFGSLDFEGVLRVTEPEPFVAALRAGFGSARSFGFTRTPGMPVTTSRSRCTRASRGSIARPAFASRRAR